MKPRILLGASLAMLVPIPAAAQTPAQRGREIAVEADRRAGGYGDLSATLRMVVRSARGAERVRELSVRMLETGDREERTVVRFSAPADLRGTALLDVSRSDGESDQWLYLPAARRVKRIAGGSRSGSFMGSEFAYEDLGTMAVDRYTYRLVAPDTVDGVPAWVVERRVEDAASRYGRQLVWFDQAEYRVLRIEFYDRDDALLKTLTLRGFRRYGDRFWRPDEMEMVNRQSGASTLLQWTDYRLGAGLPRRDFEPTRLGRAG